MIEFAGHHEPGAQNAERRTPSPNADTERRKPVPVKR
jgi:hypothetical protein